MSENLHELYDNYTRYMRDAEADVISGCGSLSVKELEKYGIRFHDFEAFLDFWKRVSSTPSLKQRWLRRLSAGFVDEKKQIDQLVDELVAHNGTRNKGAAA